MCFLGPIAIENTLRSVAKLSRVGEKIIEWAIWQGGNEVTGMSIRGVFGGQMEEGE